MAELGDAGWGELLDRHRRMVRAQIEHFGGREVTTTSDGFLVLFGQPGPAIRYALIGTRWRTSSCRPTVCASWWRAHARPRSS